MNRKQISPKKKPAQSVVDDPLYYNMEAKLMKIKDRIQRAGVRLLWAAAIPIQTEARRFLARQNAIKRMCGILTIQAVFLRWYERDSLEDNHYCSTQIQRVVRGYLATMHVFEDLYSITIVQSIVRMHLAINKAVDRLSSIIAIQSWWRGVSTRYEIGEREYSAIAIQSNWRRYLCQMAYQFDIIDIIIVQSIVRRRNAIKARDALVADEENYCATKIQSTWRSYDCSMTFVSCLLLCTIFTLRNLTISAFLSCQVHTLAEVITVQTVVRRWSTVRCLAVVCLHCLVRCFLARKRFSNDKAIHYLVTRSVSATKIQAVWRSYSAQVQMLVSIVNIIVIQVRA